jgi:hypothetical protein
VDIDFNELAKSTGKQVFDQVVSDLKDAKADVSPQDWTELYEVSLLLAELNLRATAGQDVSARIKIVAATVKNWKVAGKVKMHDVFTDVAKFTAPILGSIAAAFVRTLI